VDETQQPFNELQINNVISDLLQLLYGFLAQQHIERQSLLKKFHCLNELVEREEIQHSDSLDLYYFGNKLYIACDMTSRNIVTQANYQCQHLDYLIQCYDAVGSSMIPWYTAYLG